MRLGLSPKRGLVPANGLAQTVGGCLGGSASGTSESADAASRDILRVGYILRKILRYYVCTAYCHHARYISLRGIAKHRTRLHKSALSEIALPQGEGETRRVRLVGFLRENMHDAFWILGAVIFIFIFIFILLLLLLVGKAGDNNTGRPPGVSGSGLGRE